MRGGWRKGICFQKWGQGLSPGKHRGQPGGGGATDAAPVLSVVFQDPHITTCTRIAQAPAELYLLPRSCGCGAKFHQLSTSTEGGCFLCTILSTEVVLLPTPLFRGPRTHSCSPSLIGVFPGSPSRQTNNDSVLRVTTLTPFHRENLVPKAQWDECGRGAQSLCPPEPFGFPGGCHGSQKGISPHGAGLGLAPC